MEFPQPHQWSGLWKPVTDMYHISDQYLGKEITLTPRVPERTMSDEDKETPRVCFAPSVEQCLLGIHGIDDMSKVYTGITGWYLYETRDPLVPAGDRVPDFKHTEEHWALVPCKLRFVGIVLYDKARRRLNIDLSRGIRCGFEPTLLTLQYIFKARDIHGDKYNYDLTHYVNDSTPIYVYCGHHGYLFKVKPEDHLNKLPTEIAACPVCQLVSQTQDEGVTHE